MRHSTTYSTTNVCCKMAPFNTSFWIVSLIFRSLAVGLRPYEPGVHELDLAQALDSLDAEREEFFGLEVGADPVPRRLQVPRALVAVPHRALLLDTVRDVNLRSCGCGRAAVRGEEGGSGRGGSG